MLTCSRKVVWSGVEYVSPSSKCTIKNLQTMTARTCQAPNTWHMIWQSLIFAQNISFDLIVRENKTAKKNSKAHFFGGQIICCKKKDVEQSLVYRVWAAEAAWRCDGSIHASRPQYEYGRPGTRIRVSSWTNTCWFKGWNTFHECTPYPFDTICENVRR